MTQTSSCALLRKFSTSECTVQHMILIQDPPNISIICCTVQGLVHVHNPPQHNCITLRLSCSLVTLYQSVPLYTCPEIISYRDCNIGGGTQSGTWFVFGTRCATTLGWTIAASHKLDSIISVECSDRMVYQLCM